MGIWRDMCRWLDAHAPAVSAELVEETEAFLDGRLLECLRAGRPDEVRPWMWLNSVAHADHHRVTVLACGEVGGEVTDWRRARYRAAAELLACAGGDPQVFGSLQRDVLVPLELDLAVVPDLGPAQLADVVVEQLRLTSR